LYRYYIKEKVDLKKYGFVKRADGWYRDYGNGYMTYIDFRNEIWKVDYESSYLLPMHYRGSKYRLHDLFDAGAIRKEAF